MLQKRLLHVTVVKLRHALNVLKCLGILQHVFYMEKFPTTTQSKYRHDSDYSTIVTSVSTYSACLSAYYSYRNCHSVRPSVRPSVTTQYTDSSSGEIETPVLHHVIA